MILGFEVSNQTLSRTENSKTVEKSHNYLFCKFNFVTDDWTGMAKAALFKTSDMEKPVIRLLVNDECDFPNGTSVGNCNIAVIGGRAEDIDNITTGKKVSDTGRIITTNTINIAFEDTLDTECTADLSDPENDFTKFLMEIGVVVDRKIGDLSNLDTSDKSTVVGAINEVNADINGLENNVVSVDNNLSALTVDVGERANLTTSDTSDLVSAINEINSNSSDIDKALKRLQYYGDKDIVPSDASYFTVNETGETITGLTDTGKTQTKLVIPYKIKDVLIRRIGSSAFSYCNSLTSITIPNSVTIIESDAFINCSSLTSITIPNSVTSIESGAFGGCSSLTSITIPNSVTIIESDAFINCSSLTSITIPNSVTSIESGAFGDCSSLTSITIPNSVTIIEIGAFNGCSSLTSITIPNSVTSIGKYAFGYCSSLTSINIPNSVTSIKEGTFYDCSSLTSINIPNSVTSIESGAFYDCSNLTIICGQGSYAETYAKENNIPYRYTEVEPVVGDLSNLGTSDKSTVVGAINEIHAEAASIADNTTVIAHEYGGFAAGRGAVVQQENNSGSPIAIGVSAKAKYNGTAIGPGAKSTGSGTAMGQVAECDGRGFAAGYCAKTGHGIAIGDQAKTVDANGKGIDAVQLGKGRNNTPKTMQVYDKRIVEADGSLTDVGNLSDLNTADKTSIVSAVNEVNSKTDSKSDKVTISASAQTASELEMAHNTEIRYGEMTSLTITLPETLPDDYISSVVFTSGVTAVNMVYPETIKMSGEGCIDGVFVPAANKRYTVILSYDGVYVSGIVGGVGI